MCQITCLIVISDCGRPNPYFKPCHIPYALTPDTTSHHACRVVDTLPKQWGGAGSAAVSVQLEDKSNSHQLLLQCLQDGGCLPRLPPSVLR